MIKVALDAMGGDNSPQEIVKGAVEALSKSAELSVILTGPKERIENELKQYTFDKSRLRIEDAPEVITLDESPVAAIQKKKDSSIVRGLMLLKTGEADAFLSAGSSGAVLAGGQLKIGRIKGVDRTPLATLIPTETTPSLLLDCGANVDAKPQWLLQFARMGQIYMSEVCGISNPSVKLVNIGLEEEKGNNLIKETKPLIEALPELNYQGYIESREIPHHGADVVVADAFTGNVILKLYEGVGSTLISAVRKGLMTDLRTKIGALLIKPALKKTLRRFGTEDNGGAPLLGLKGLVMKCHGNATHVEISNALLQCESFVKLGINDKISEALLKDKKIFEVNEN
ncbi:MAG: phosphate acyltransferase PlsX [Eubacteriales bacterium]|nr:phosphate acyltransferase PlsX [Eubacteriales bacterium]